MANVNLTINFVEKAKPNGKEQHIRDKIINELVLRIGPTGTKGYYLDVKLPQGKRTMKKIGDAVVLTPQMAREKAKEMLLQIQAGESFKPKLTLKMLIDKYYTAYCHENFRTAKEMLSEIIKHFDWLMNRPIESITTIEIQQWRSTRIKDVTQATANRNVDALKGAISYAHKHKLIDTNPLRGFAKLPEEDSEEMVRYLSDDERARLMVALDEREAEMRAKRARTRAHAKGEHLPDTSETVFADYLKPLILTALGTGFRKRALFGLRWSDIDFEHDKIMLRGSNAKNKKTTILPMSAKVKSVLAAWQQQSDSDVVFPSPKSNGEMDNVDVIFEGVMESAKIENFRFHDMRHDFASQLVMKGVSLYVVKELMTHASIKTTERYAHLAPDVRQKAVDLI